jgi:hypothetical protein
MATTMEIRAILALVATVLLVTQQIVARLGITPIPVKAVLA